MAVVTLADAPRIMLMPDQVAALGLPERPTPGTTFVLTAPVVVESTSAPGLRPEGDSYAMRLRLDGTIHINTGA